MVFLEAKRHFKLRVLEWWTSIALLMWGGSLLYYPTMFEVHRVYDIMDFFSQPAWGLIALIVAIARLLCLTVNGFWKRSPHGRMLTSALSAAIWFMISYSFWQFPVPNTGTFIYSCLVLADIYSASRAGVDWVDQRAKYLFNATLTPGR